MLAICQNSFVLLKPTGGKDEQNIVFMRKSIWTAQHRTPTVNRHNRTTHKY
jgi:hypothetical protein